MTIDMEEIEKQVENISVETKMILTAIVAGTGMYFMGRARGTRVGYTAGLTEGYTRGATEVADMVRQLRKDIE